MSLTIPSRADLRAHEGKHIRDICDNAFASDERNHCAHFVCHVLNISHGVTCARQVHRTHRRSRGAAIKVRELFHHCLEAGRWADRGSLDPCFVFIIQSSLIDLSRGRGRRHQMGRTYNKHVGIYLGGTIWHYSNTNTRVMTATPEQFSRHYSGSGYGLSIQLMARSSSIRLMAAFWVAGKLIRGIPTRLESPMIRAARAICGSWIDRTTWFTTTVEQPSG